jgi:hypothetical protein
VILPLFAPKNKNMTRIKTGFLLACSLAFHVTCSAAFGQTFAQAHSVNAKDIRLSIIPTFGANTVVIGDSAFQANDAHHTHIDVLKFYISRIQFVQNGVVVLEEARSFHLIDAAVQATFHLAIPNKGGARFDAVRFHLGIDSLTSVSGAMGGDLDPTKGMYWTWQSGYINVKCEGKSERSPARNKEFQYHLGGYKPPLSALQTLTFPASGNEAMTIQFDVETFLSKIDMATHHRFMSPSVDAVRLSGVAAESFRVVNSGGEK